MREDDGCEAAADAPRSKRPYRDLGRRIYYLRRNRTRLTRDELADRVSLSSAAITSYEQGRVRPAPENLRAIAAALRLPENEQTRLFELAAYSPRSIESTGGEAPATLAALAANLSTLPSQISDEHWRFLAWNRATEVCFGYTADPARHDPPRMIFVPAPHRNPLYLVHHPAYGFRQRVGSDEVWSQISETQVAWFKSEIAAFADEPWAKAMIDDLCRVSPEFAREWVEAEVYDLEDYVVSLATPLGRICFQSVITRLAAMPTYTLVTYVPCTDEDVQRFQQIMAALGAADEEFGRERSAITSVAAARSYATAQASPVC